MGQLPVVVVLVGPPPAALHVRRAPLSEGLGQGRGARVLAAGYDDAHGFLRVVACRRYLIIVEWGESHHRGRGERRGGDFTTEGTEITEEGLGIPAFGDVCMIGLSPSPQPSPANGRGG